MLPVSKLSKAPQRPSHSLSRAEFQRLARPSPEALAAGTSAEIETGSLSIIEYLRVLRRHSLLLAVITAATVGAAFLVSIAQPRLYQSVASVEVQGLNENFLNLRDVNPTATAPTHSEDSYIETQAEILRQDSLIGRAFNRLPAERRGGLVLPGWSERLLPVFAPRSPGGNDDREAILRVKDRLRIEPSKQGRIIRILCDATDPQLAADFANALAQVFIEQSVEARWNGASQIREWLNPQLEELKGKLVKSEGELQAYLRSSGLIFGAGQETLAENRLHLIESELSKAQADRIAKTPAYQLADKEHPELLVDNAVIRDYQVKLTELRKQLADLDSVLTPENYKVVRLKAQITALESALAKEREETRQRLRNDYLTARRREALLSSAYQQQTHLASDLRKKMIHYDTLNREVATTRQFYEAMLQKVNDAGVATAIRPSNIRVVGPAQPALQPYKPNFLLNVAIGLFGGLVLAIGCVTVVNQAEAGRSREPGDVEARLNLVELGAIPSARSVVGASPGRSLRSDSHNATELTGWENKFNALSESFRCLVTSILRLGGDEGQSPPRVLVITSTLPAEGKTTVATNLGITLASIQRRVLLIDGDMRQPRIHHIFDLPNTWGFSNLLRGADELPMDTIVKRTTVPNLYVLSSGPGTEDIFSLLFSPRLRRLIERFREEFDHVIIDAPPSLEFADARLLGLTADGVLMVVRANHTDNKTVQLAIQRLLTDGVPVLGTVLNDWNPNIATYGYYRYGKSYSWKNAET
ncbi:MAG: hypothetical protein DMG06_18785 [Acidobacteria bacterium]|nr:MAG: hypothetical protein DMG06_18785 [Acidobacteriota bacterium]